MVLQEAVNLFPPQLKKVYTLYIDRQLSVNDIAAEMELSQHTVRNYLERDQEAFESRCRKPCLAPDAVLQRLSDPPLHVTQIIKPEFSIDQISAFACTINKVIIKSSHAGSSSKEILHRYIHNKATEQELRMVEAWFDLMADETSMEQIQDAEMDEVVQPHQKQSEVWRTGASNGIEKTGYGKGFQPKLAGRPCGVVSW